MGGGWREREKGALFHLLLPPNYSIAYFVDLFVILLICLFIRRFIHSSVSPGQAGLYYSVLLDRSLFQLRFILILLIALGLLVVYGKVLPAGVVWL